MKIILIILIDLINLINLKQIRPICLFFRIIKIISIIRIIWKRYLIPQSSLSSLIPSSKTIVGSQPNNFLALLLSAPENL